MLLWARYSFSNMLLLACWQAIIFCVHARWPFILVSHWNLNSYNILPDPELSAPPALSLHLLCSSCPLGPLAFSYLLQLPDLFVLPHGTVCSFYLELLILFFMQLVAFYPSDQSSYILSSQRTFLTTPYQSGITCLREPWLFTYQAVSTD